MSKLLRVGVIGLGAMGKNHARVYYGLPGVELVAVCDIDEQAATNLAERYSAEAFTDYRQLLNQELDAISIVVPTSLHREVALAAAVAGVNMLVEKPIAHTLEAARDIIRVAASSGVKLMVGYIERFNPVIPVIRRLLESAEVGLIEITRIGPFPPRIRDVGIVIDLATHDIDLIRHITGSEFKCIYGLTSSNVSMNDDVAVLLFEMANGILARVTVNWITPFKVREIAIATKDKYIKGLLIDQKVIEYSSYREDGSYITKELNVPFNEPLKLELEAFLEAVKGNKEIPVTGDDGYKALEAAMKCLSRAG